MTTTPRPIDENPIYRKLQIAEAMIRDVYRGRQKALLLFGPPGIGKTETVKRVSTSEGHKWRPERPGTMLGLLECLRLNRGGGVLQLDDIDSLWDDPKCLGLLKVALESGSAPRYISHTVGTRSASIAPFELKCGVIFLSNKDFNDARQFRHDIEPIKDRAILSGLSFDPMDMYEYTGWLCTSGGMLRRLCVHEENHDWFLTLRQANEVMEHFAEHAARYRQISPRTLAKFAMMRIGVPHSLWLAKIAEQMSDKPIWQFPAPLPVYAEVPPSARREPEPEPAPEPPVKKTRVRRTTSLERTAMRAAGLIPKRVRLSTIAKQAANAAAKEAAKKKGA